MAKAQNDTEMALYASLDLLIDRLESHSTFVKWAFRAFLALFALAGLATLAPLIVQAHPRPVPVDFTSFWAAGQAWADGYSPYTDAYTNAFIASGASFNGAAPPPFFYPPNAFVLVAGFGFLDLATASAVMAMVNLAAFVCAALLFAMIFTRKDEWARRGALTALFIGICGGYWTSVEMLFTHNTPAFIFYAGFFGCLVAVKYKSAALFALGLFVCLMKPQLGVPIFVAGMLAPQTRMASCGAALATGAAALAGLFAGAPHSLLAFLHNLAAYGDFWVNTPPHVSGPGTLLFLLTGVKLSAFVFLFISIATVIAAYVMSRERERDDNFAFNLIVFAAISSAFLLPAHNNYYIALAPAFLLLPAGRAGKVALCAAAAATIFAWDISSLLTSLSIGVRTINVALIDSLATAALLIVCLRSMKFAKNMGPVVRRLQPAAAPQ